MSRRQLKVAVLMGGIGPEREVSLQSGSCVVEALIQAGFDVVPWDIDPQRLQILNDHSIDVFFVALHGPFGEDGQLQQILEDRHLVYTGSGPAACALTMDKVRTKLVFEQAGVPTPRCTVFTDATSVEDLRGVVAGWAEDKVVVKPISGGSSVGVQIVGTQTDLWELCRKTSQDFGDCMVEQFIRGQELTVGVLAGRPLPIIEIRPHGGFYDYHAKYIDDRTLYLFDTVEPSLARIVQDKALAAFDALGLRHMARIDFILDPQGRLYALEANTIPGMTSHSLLPKAAARVGLSMADLCGTVVMAACPRVVSPGVSETCL